MPEPERRSDRTVHRAAAGELALVALWFGEGFLTGDKEFPQCRV